MEIGALPTNKLLLTAPACIACTMYTSPPASSQRPAVGARVLQRTYALSHWSSHSCLHLRACPVACPRLRGATRLLAN
jgi:hypothetical protein